MHKGEDRSKTVKRLTNSSVSLNAVSFHEFRGINGKDFFVRNFFQP